MVKANMGLASRASEKSVGPGHRLGIVERAKRQVELLNTEQGTWPDKKWSKAACRKNLTVDEGAERYPWEHQEAAQLHQPALTLWGPRGLDRSSSK